MTKYWPGTSIPRSTGNAFTVRPGEPSIVTLTDAHRPPARGRPADRKIDTEAVLKMRHSGTFSRSTVGAKS